MRRHEEERRQGGEQTRMRGRVRARENIARRGTSNIFKCLGVGSLRHGLPSLHGPTLHLECRRIEGLVVVVLLFADGGCHLEPTAVGICGEGTKGAKKRGIEEVGVEHK
ncbi:hypothetical protein JHK85_001897 [Glycine max]|nr:hypothetical protein JHK85_001897 [Glycine max]KAG5089231.1 hypothetical protein JHK86_001843 [Glycine max]